MLSRNQEIIRDYFNNIYKDILANPYILTSITIPEETTIDIVNIIGTFNPEIKRNQNTSMPVIAINFIDENTMSDTYEELKEVYLKEVNSIILKLINNSSILYSLSLDYRLITDDLLECLKRKYNEARFTLRIIGEDYTMTPEVYEKLSFIDEIIVSKISENIVELNSSDLITNNHLVIDNIIPNRGYEPINEFYIVKELTKEEYSLVVDKINNTVSKTKKLFIRLYKPEIYESIINCLLEFKLDESVEINFLSNPLEDKSKDFECMKTCPNKVTITYSTDKNRIIKLTKEPYSDSAHYIEELECNGKIESIDYLNILYGIDFLQRKSILLELSPLEKLIYVYRYIEKNNFYLKKNDICKERTYINKYSFAKLYSIYLRKIGVPCFVYTTNTKLKNIYRVQDKKYKIDRILVSDITSDIETNRYDFYKIYSFSYFGMSPIDTLRFKEADYITIPASIVLSKDSYMEYNNRSYSSIIRKNNLTKNLYDFTIKFFNLIGYDTINSSTSKDECYSFISNLLSENVMDSLEESILKSAVERIVNKEINDTRAKQKEFEITNTIASNRIGRTELTNQMYILLNQSKTKDVVKVTLLESKNKNEEFNKQKSLFTNTAEKIIKDIFNIKKDSILRFETNDHLVEAMNNSLIELYNNKVEYPLIVNNNKKRILKTIYNKYEKLLYKEIPENLYNYLKEEIIPEIELINNSKELNYLLACTEDDYNSNEYNRNYLRISNKIKYFIDKLNSSDSKRLGISYDYSDYNLTIKLKNSSINNYSIQLVSAEIVAISKVKEKNKFVLTSTIIDTKKVKEYIEVYLDKLNKYNDLIGEVNKNIAIIEDMNLLISKININKFIEIEKNLTKIEEKIFKQKIELSNFRNNFYNKFDTHITTYKEVKSFVLNNYKYLKKYNIYVDLFNNVEKEIIRLGKENFSNIDKNQNIQELLSFIDYIISYINRRIISENNPHVDLSNIINNLYQRKSQILNQLNDIEENGTDANILLKKENLKYREELINIAIPEIKIHTLDKTLYHKLKQVLKLKLNTQALNKLKNTKKHLVSHPAKLI